MSDRCHRYFSQTGFPCQSIFPLVAPCLSSLNISAEPACRTCVTAGISLIGIPCVLDHLFARAVLTDCCWEAETRGGHRSRWAQLFWYADLMTDCCRVPRYCFVSPSLPTSTLSAASMSRGLFRLEGGSVRSSTNFTDALSRGHW